MTVIDRPSPARPIRGGEWSTLAFGSESASESLPIGQISKLLHTRRQGDAVDPGVGAIREDVKTEREPLFGFLDSAGLDGSEAPMLVSGQAVSISPLASFCRSRGKHDLGVNRLVNPNAAIP